MCAPWSFSRMVKHCWLNVHVPWWEFSVVSTGCWPGCMLDFPVVRLLISEVLISRERLPVHRIVRRLTHWPSFSRLCPSLSDLVIVVVLVLHSFSLQDFWSVLCWFPDKYCSKTFAFSICFIFIHDDYDAHLVRGKSNHIRFFHWFWGQYHLCVARKTWRIDCRNLTHHCLDMRTLLCCFYHFSDHLT